MAAGAIATGVITAHGEAHLELLDGGLRLDLLLTTYSKFHKCLLVTSL